MNGNYFSIEDSNRLIVLNQRCQNLKWQQIRKLTEEIMICKEEIFRQSNILYNFLNKLYNIIPKEDVKFKKKSIKYQWIKVFLDQSKMTYTIHQDYQTYLIYNKISISNIEQELIKQSDIRSDFEAEITSFIYEKNQKFLEAFLQNDAYSQNKMQLEVNNSSLIGLIGYLNDVDDILTEEDFISILKFMKILMIKLFQKEYQGVANIIKKHFKEFIKNYELEPCNYPQNVNYNDFGEGFEAAKIIQQQNKIQEIKETEDLNQLKNGIYYIVKKKTIFIFEVTRNEKNAYIINEFEHYKQNTFVILDKLYKFNIYKIRTIKLKIEEAYILIKNLKKRKQFEKQQNQTIEIYKKIDFERINMELQNQINKFYSIQDNIKYFIKKINPQSNNNLEIYSIAFVTELQKKKIFDFELIPIKQFDLKKINLKFEQSNLGEILVDEKNLTIGVVVYLNKWKFMIYLNKIKTDNPCLNQVNNSEQLLKIQTNVKEIDPQVAQFYISLLLYKQENKVSKQIKDFLELKNQVWNSILKFLD
ncbi:unnamed protein product [Paramecium sonneborni]|uniref:Uncharacterized protein n=1 Tax=Paramecium sonneborni TaxID=65129 RepID=A0A8S1LW73_9CILI|nr:unnamed protein product [Paramecium sonneborni]